MSAASPKPRIALNSCPKCEAVVAATAAQPGQAMPCPRCGLPLRLWSFPAGLQVFDQHSAERAIALTAEKLGVHAEKITPGNDWEELGADSLDVAEILMELEGEFNINLTSEDAEQVRTVGDVIRAVDSALAENKGNCSFKVTTGEQD